MDRQTSRAADGVISESWQKYHSIAVENVNCALYNSVFLNPIIPQSADENLLTWKNATTGIFRHWKWKHSSENILTFPCMHECCTIYVFLSVCLKGKASSGTSQGIILFIGRPICKYKDRHDFFHEHYNLENLNVLYFLINKTTKIIIWMFYLRISLGTWFNYCNLFWG